MNVVLVTTLQHWKINRLKLKYTEKFLSPSYSLEIHDHIVLADIDIKVQYQALAIPSK